MSTEIKSAKGSRRTIYVEPSIHAAGHTWVGVDGNGAAVPTADLLAAVETECHVRLVPADAIVIERGEVPPVVVTDDTYEVDGNSWPKRMAHNLVGGIRADALAELALGEYLRAHPPVDEAQVEELTTALVADSHVVIGNPAVLRDLARRLVVAGWSK